MNDMIDNSNKKLDPSLFNVENLPEAPPRYKNILDDYKDTVVVLQNKGYTAQYISDFFTDRGVEISVQAVRNYLKKLSKANRGPTTL